MVLAKSTRLRDEATTAALAERRMRQWALSLEAEKRRQLRSADERRQPHEKLQRKLHPYIAISREAGAGGEEIARQVGDILGWEVLDRNIVDEIARHDKLPRAMLQLVDETTSNWVTETFGKWIDRHTVTQSEYVVHLGHVVLMAAQHASTVFVGRGAQFLLPADKGLTVYVVAPYDMRVENTRKTQICSADEARRHIEKRDDGRRDFLKENYDRGIDDLHLYDLVINRANISVETAARLIVDQARVRFPDATSQGE